MSAVCASAGLTSRLQLAEDTPVPTQLSEAFGLATDDVIHLSSCRKKAARRMRRLDAAFNKHGVKQHAAKNVDSVLDGTCLGTDLTDGLYLSPSSQSFFHLLCCCSHIATSRSDFMLQPKQLASLTGLAQWYCLLNRPLLSLLCEVYVFQRQLPDNVPVVLPKGVKTELRLFACLAAYTEVDLTRCWDENLYASDASPAYGFGLSAARLGQTAVQRLAAKAQRTGCCVRMHGEEGIELPRSGAELRLPISRTSFRTLLSIKAGRVAHSGEMEATGVTLMLRWITRSVERHNRRCCLLVDAQAVLGALAKGRSSAGTLQYNVRRVGALCVATNILARYVYIPSESNPADAPSRGKRCRL
jgi:hypothetical protein